MQYSAIQTTILMLQIILVERAHTITEIQITQI